MTPSSDPRARDPRDPRDQRYPHAAPYLVQEGLSGLNEGCMWCRLILRELGRPLTAYGWQAEEELQELIRRGETSHEALERHECALHTQRRHAWQRARKYMEEQQRWHGLTQDTIATLNAEGYLGYYLYRDPR